MKQREKAEGAAVDASRSHPETDVLSALRSSELSYLNEHHSYPVEERTSGIAAGLKARLGRWLFGDYFEREHRYHSKLVQHLNELSSRLERALVRLEDRREGGLYAFERRANASVESIRGELNRLSGERARESGEFESRLGTLESVTTGLERIVSRLTRPTEAPVGGASSSVGAIDYSYLLLENRFRGSEDEIKARLACYPPLFARSSLPVFEMGSGRGELQTLFREAGIASVGCEQDEAMLERCAELNLDVRRGDGLKLLREAEARSLGGFIAIQVVEHLPIEVLKALLREIEAKLVPGSAIVLETINSESVVALCRNYFRDPTHTAPLHPDTLRFLVESAGLRVREVKKLSPYPEGAVLQRLEADQFLPPRMRTIVETLNHNIEVLNALLFGFQDYALIAEVPSDVG